LNLIFYMFVEYNIAYLQIYFQIFLKLKKR
jgi:hypothetical protein